MSRSGYSYDCENLWLYRRAVDNALTGRRGQAFLRELLAALDAMPQKRLIVHELQEVDGEVCAIGSVGVVRQIDMSDVDPNEPTEVAAKFGIATCMAQEIVYINDECGIASETPEYRWERVRKWVAEKIRAEQHTEPTK
jgi:hypothetical protein